MDKQTGRKKLQFSIDSGYLCHSCNSRTLFYEDVPDEWEQMTEGEREEYAQQVWHDSVQWGWSVVDAAEQQP